jgi:hypothetical protein
LYGLAANDENVTQKRIRMKLILAIDGSVCASRIKLSVAKVQSVEIKRLLWASASRSAP